MYLGHSVHDVEYFACAMSSLYTRLIILYEVVLIPLKCYTETINTTKLSSITTAIYSFHHNSRKSGDHVLNIHVQSLILLCIIPSEKI